MAKKEKNSKVFVLVPTHNRAKILDKCLKNLDQQTYPYIQTVVVNDGSTDKTQQILAKFPHVVTLHGNGDLWWTGAMNRALKHTFANAKKGDFVLLMNDDTEFGKNYIDSIVKDSQKHNRSIIGSICYDIKDRKTPVELGVYCHWHQAAIGKVDPTTAELKKGYHFRSDTFCGRGTLIPIEIATQAGYFDSRLPHYGADYEYFIRAKRLGARLVFSFKSKVYRNAKPGGIKFNHLSQKHLSFKQWSDILFATRSKSNIIKDFRFANVAVPLKYRHHFYLRNIKRLVHITTKLL